MTPEGCATLFEFAAVKGPTQGSPEVKNDMIDLSSGQPLWRSSEWIYTWAKKELSLIDVLQNAHVIVIVKITAFTIVVVGLNFVIYC